MKFALDLLILQQATGTTVFGKSLVKVELYFYVFIPLPLRKTY